MNASPSQAEASAKAAIGGDLDYFIKLVDDFGDSALKNPDPLDRPLTHHAAGYGHVELLGWLLEHGVDREATCREMRNTAAHVAVNHNQADALAVLFAHGANLAARNRIGATPLMFAAASGYGKCVAQLLDALPDRAVIARDPEGQSAALRAAANGKTEVYATLHRCHPDPDAADKQGRTALYWASKRRDVRLRDYLVHEAGARPEYAALLHADVNFTWLTEALAEPTRHASPRLRHRQGGPRP
jgi:ankyrin repeat protein